MRILGVDSSAKAASVCILDHGSVITHLFQNSGLTHSETLVPMIRQALAESGFTLDEIDALAVTIGPGSFTGLRIGLAAVKGIALGANKKVVPVSTLEAMAEPLREMHVNVCAVMDARRNELYNAVFDTEGKRLTEDRAIPIEVLEKDLQTLSGPILLVGDGSQLCYNHFKEKPWELCIADEQMQCRGALGAAMWTERVCPTLMDAETIVPNYLRLSQAERERNERLK